jgi:pyruvyltransferase
LARLSWYLWSRELIVKRGRRLAKALMGRHVAARRQRPDRLRRIVSEYEVGPLIEHEGRVPVRWWVKANNFGDLLSPWLIARMTGREVEFADPKKPHYVAIGSILNRANRQSEVWGAGSFGTEDGAVFATGATYHAVRGPLSRVRLLTLGIPCPEAYGDPALLAPAYFAPKVKKSFEYGIVTRWSERHWYEAELGPEVRIIDLATADVEGVIEAILSCRRIVTGSLHGLIMADAYGIPSAWVRSPTAYGGQYKFFDYFATVRKFRTPRDLDLSLPVTAARLRDALEFDGRPIVFDYPKLLDACPFLKRVEPESRPPDRGTRATTPETLRAAGDGALTGFPTSSEP